MTTNPSSPIACELKQLADDTEAAEPEMPTIELADMMMRNAAQLRFVAVMVTTAPNGTLDPLGEAWISAGRRFLDALLERARMDAVHESRASRRLCDDLAPVSLVADDLTTNYRCGREPGHGGLHASPGRDDTTWSRDHSFIATTMGGI